MISSKGSDQTAHVRRLVWAFAVRTYHIVGILMSRLIYASLINIIRKLVKTRFSIYIFKLAKQTLHIDPFKSSF